MYLNYLTEGAGGAGVSRLRLKLRAPGRAQERVRPDHFFNLTANIEPR